MMMQRLSGKVALITGASRGLGKSVALGFAQEGADVVVNYLRDATSAEETATSIRELNRRSYVIQADASKRCDVKRMFDKAIDVFGRIDVLVNNAGINKRGWFHEITDELGHDFRHQS